MIPELDNGGSSLAFPPGRRESLRNRILHMRDDVREADLPDRIGLQQV